MVLIKTTLVGTYFCECNEGFELPVGTQQCDNINECKEGIHVCHLNADCTDTAGSYTCACFSGFNGDGFKCVDIDECLTSADICQQNCINTPGTFACACDRGYQENGDSCNDNDECSLGTHNCDFHADCTNVDSGFRCDCQLGYEGDGIQCFNINECLQNSHDCHSDGKCRDTEGSYECECNHGYDGTGNGPVGCQDIDECDTTYITTAAAATADSGHNCIGLFHKYISRIYISS